MLQAAPAAPAEVRAGRLHPVGRGLQDLLDDAAAEAGARLGEPDLQPIARQPAGDEDHVSVGATHTFAPEGEVVDGQGQNLPSLGPRHGSATINVRQNGVNLAPAPAETVAAGGGLGSSEEIDGRVSWGSDAECRSLSLSRPRGRPAARGRSRARGPAARRAHPAGLARRGGRRARAPLATRRAEGAARSTIIVDNSPWLQELTLRSAEVLARSVPASARPSPRCAWASPARPRERPAAAARDAPDRLPPSRSRRDRARRRALAPVQDPELATRCAGSCPRTYRAPRPRARWPSSCGGAALGRRARRLRHHRRSQAEPAIATAPARAPAHRGRRARPTTTT